MGSDPGPAHWRDAIDTDLPCWADHLELIERLPAGDFPDAAALGRLLPPGLGHSGRPPIHFVPSEAHAPGPYEQRVFEQGAVSTRPGNWHDLFNALSWALLPRTKLAMNALHCSIPARREESGRSPVRDALTLFDECGVILACTDRTWLERLARHDWERCLCGQDAFFAAKVTLVVAGHALLEKMLAPYPSMTGNALLLHIGPETQALPRPARIGWLDRRLSLAMAQGAIPARPADLSPLPLMGIPGWWPGLRQDRAFYADRAVFRPLARDRQQASIRTLT